MTGWLQRQGVADWLTWAACGLAVIVAVAALALPAGGSNRVIGVAAPFAVAAVLLAANALRWQRPGWLDGLIFSAAGLAITYGILLALSLPLRLAVEGTCPPQTATCPLGFDRPITTGENAVVYIAAILGALALLLVFTAFEARHMRRPRPRIEQPRPPST